MQKKRLDQHLVDLKLATSRAKAHALILAGQVKVNGQVQTKAGHTYPLDASIELKETPRYVSRGGEKLEGALRHFNLSVSNFFCLDVGASTGGFTDCLLQHGAKHVFAVDVGKGQLDSSLRAHPQVTSHESFHANQLHPGYLPQPVDLAVVDVSFISLTKVIPHVLPCIRTRGFLLALIKPQFEAQKKDVPKGVVRDELKRQEILSRIRICAVEEWKLEDVQIEDAVIQGPKGNREAFLFGRWPGK